MVFGDAPEKLTLRRKRIEEVHAMAPSPPSSEADLSPSKAEQACFFMPQKPAGRDSYVSLYSSAVAGVLIQHVGDPNLITKSLSAHRDPGSCHPVAGGAIR